jgi:hypothetical protein
VRRISNGTLRGNWYDINAAVGMVKMIEDQPDLMAMPPAPTNDEREAMSRLERRVDQVVAMVASGFKDGECVAAERVDPSRMATLADKLVLARQTVGRMERQTPVKTATASEEMADSLPDHSAKPTDLVADVDPFYIPDALKREKPAKPASVKDRLLSDIPNLNSAQDCLHWGMEMSDTFDTLSKKDKELVRNALMMQQAKLVNGTGAGAA